MTRVRSVVAHLFGCVAGGMESWLHAIVEATPHLDWRVWIEEGGRTSETALLRFRNTFGASEWALAARGAEILISPGHRVMQTFSGRKILVAHGSQQFTANLMEKFGEYADQIVAVSVAASRTVPERFRDKLELVLHGVEIDVAAKQQRHAMRKSWGCDEDQLLLGFIGRLGPDKCPEQTARAAKLLNTIAVFVGSEWQDGMCQRILQEWPRCIFAGECYDMPAVYAALDCVVMCSRAEGFGLVLAECLAAGVPLVSTRVGILDDFYGRYGPLCCIVAQDPASADLEAAVRKALSEDRAEFRSRARDIVRNELHAGRMVRRWQALLGEQPAQE